MVNIFRNFNPLAVVLLFFYGILTRLASFLKPVAPLSDPDDGYLYKGLHGLLSGPVGHLPMLAPALAYLTVFVQALMLNRIVNSERLIARQSFLPAMAYLLVTALFTEWWVFSSALLVNTILIWVWGSLIALLNNKLPGNILFNTGMALSLASLLHTPSWVFVLLIYASLLVMGPFRFNNWFIALAGLLMPYYFLLSWQYLTGMTDMRAFLPAVRLQMPAVRPDPYFWAALGILLGLFLIGSYYIRKYIFRMLIRNRKSWTLLLFYLVLSALSPFLAPSGAAAAFILTAPAFSLFHANAFFQPATRTVPTILHWCVVAFIAALNYATLP